ncbi:hypothetical protein BDZ91DRAFT_794489 [Kalaharituber pfeilii]|nr:hypothetical protein BDZ91DRAFT_794489 [Kalaharituber pfeilii]
MKQDKDEDLNKFSQNKCFYVLTPGFDPSCRADSWVTEISTVYKNDGNIVMRVYRSELAIS